MRRVGVCYIVFGMIHSMKRNDDDPLTKTHRVDGDGDKGGDRDRDGDGDSQEELFLRWDINTFIDSYYSSSSTSKGRDGDSDDRQQHRRGYRIVGASPDDNFGHAVSNAGTDDMTYTYEEDDDVVDDDKYYDCDAVHRHLFYHHTSSVSSSSYHHYNL